VAQAGTSSAFTAQLLVQTAVTFPSATPRPRGTGRGFATVIRGLATVPAVVSGCPSQRCWSTSCKPRGCLPEVRRDAAAEHRPVLPRDGCCQLSPTSPACAFARVRLATMPSCAVCVRAA